ncbi:response regulator [Mucilaginibacter terrae]|uniref:CheY-like chemotaxis protein n=1 Tax=Mucilaginibacter terrae TaxID=1955052 RepID=A0ABU3GPD9_9SPHI|nr:response regulator [Mucilaginibacter terrae]MDT3401648.1 CheY-like chemotaxis protein [Mucilaginibacter terrae]
MGAPDIIYIEDNIDYIDVVERALSQIDSKTILRVFENGTLALTELGTLVENKVKPRLILIDLNLPGLSGLDLLRKIKETPVLRYVPTVIFSTSDNPKDVRISLASGANAYVAKPLGYNDLIKCLNSMHEFWLKTTLVA